MTWKMPRPQPTGESRARFLVEVLDDLVADREYHNGDNSARLDILEVGTIRNTRGELSDGHSTSYIAKWVDQHPGSTFHSIDLETDVAEGYLRGQGLLPFVTLHRGDALKIIPREWSPGPRFDLVYLDGPDDPAWTCLAFDVAEARLRRGGVIALDDCDLRDPLQVKGRALVPKVMAQQREFWHQDRIFFVRGRR